MKSLPSHYGRLVFIEEPIVQECDATEMIEEKSDGNKNFIYFCYQ